MPNPVELRATVAVIRENLPRWNQAIYIAGKVNPLVDYHDCGTTACAAGWTCLRKGYRPTFYQAPGPLSGYATGTFCHPDTPDLEELPEVIAAGILELDSAEQEAVFCCFTDDIEAFAARVEEVIAGEWSAKDVIPVF